MIVTVPGPSRTTQPRPSASPTLPTLPFEIIRRIIRHRLALSPSYPDDPSLHVSSRSLGSWDSLAGQTAKKAQLRRVEEREDVMEAAMVLMRVCKQWKISGTSFLLLAEAVVKGDKKWDNLRLHPHSLPGRYITTLDLSQLSWTYFSPHITATSKALQAVFPLMPNITHLKLPTGHSPFTLADLAAAPFCRKLRALEGVSCSDELDREGHDPAVELLRECPNIEVLTLFGPGMSGTGIRWESYPQKALHLPRLHTLSMDGLKSSLILSTLIHSELPNLRRLLLTSYYDCVEDLTYTFQEIHGSGIISLTYLPTREWPSIHPCPPLDILSLHPNLRHISFLLPHSVLQANQALALSLGGNGDDDHPLEITTIPKWMNLAGSGTSPSPSPAPTPLPQTQALTNYFGDNPSSSNSTSSARSNKFLNAILRVRPKNLKVITVDGFTWVSPQLGRAALQAGASGEMRVWAARLREKGISLCDGEGKEAPKPAGQGGGLSAGPGWAAGGTGPMIRGRRMSRNDQRVMRADWDVTGNGMERKSSREQHQGDDQDGG